MVRHGHGISVEVVGSMLEMADMAWHAFEHRCERGVGPHDDHEAARLRDENHRLRTILSDNLALLQTIYNSPEVSLDCPPDVSSCSPTLRIHKDGMFVAVIDSSRRKLHSRLLAAVENSNFLEKLESLHEGSKCVENSGLPITNDIDANQSGTEVAIKVGDAEPSWWVWVVHEITPDCLEEISGIDNENYVIISEENVVDGISNYIARCIIEHPNSKILTPEELQKVVTKAMGVTKDRRKWKDIWEAGKVIYTLSTWGIALAGLYRHRAIVKAAVKGVGASANLVMKAL